MTTETKEKKYNISYEEVVITNRNGLANLPQTFTIENCEVYSSSICAEKTGYSKSIRFLLPDKDFKAIDRKICNYFTQQIQNGNENLPPDPNCETFKSCVKEIVKKDILDNKFPEHLEGRYTLNIYTTSVGMYGTEKNDAGEIVSKKITKMEQSLGNDITYKHYSVNDEFSGEAIKPQIFKYQNGEKVTTFINSKTKVERNLYVGAQDLVNIVVRPYMKKNEVTGDWYCKYNILSIEIVQSAFDRGKSNYKKSNTEKKEPLQVSFDGFGAMFGNTETVATPIKAETKTAKNVEKVPTTKSDMPTVESTTSVPGQGVEVTQVQAELPKTDTAPMFDFSQLGSDLSNINLGD